MLRTCVLFTLLAMHNSAFALEREMTVNIEPRKEDCFYQTMKPGLNFEFEYQVIDGGHGDLDITFHIVDPDSRIIASDFKKSENSHKVDNTMNGDYRFCFDNTYSSFNTKTVFFELVVYDEESEWGSEEKNLPGLRPEAVYDMAVQDMQEVMNSVRNHLTKVRHMQELLKSIEARDRNVVEENFFKVNTFSMVQIGIMIAVGLVQVVMVRSLFDDTSKVHKIWKSLGK